MEAGWGALMSVEVVARVSQRTLANVVIEESNLMVQPGVIAKKSLYLWL